MTIAPILSVPQLGTSNVAMIYILSICVAFALPSLVVDWRSSVAAARSRKGILLPYRSPVLIRVVVSLQFFWIGLVATHLSRQGLDLGTIVANPLEIGCLYLGRRYSGSMAPTIFAQAATVINYVAVALAGVGLASRGGVFVRVAVLAIAFLPSIFAVLFLADKGTIFLAAAFFYGGVIVARLTSGDTALVNWATIGTSALAVVIVIPVMMLAMLNRGGGACSDMQRTIEIMSVLQGGDGSSVGVTDSAALRTSGMLFALRSYAFGHLFAFSDWMEHYVFGASVQQYTDPPGLTWGYWTFMAIGKFIYPAYQLPPGYYTEYIVYDGVLQTNIYTIFRGLIYDFGLYGSLMFAAIIGAFSSFIFKRVLEHRVAPFSQASYILIVGFIYSSYIFSPFTWNSVYAAPVGIAIVLAFLGFLESRKSGPAVDSGDF